MVLGVFGGTCTGATEQLFQPFSNYQWFKGSLLKMKDIYFRMILTASGRHFLSLGKQGHCCLTVALAIALSYKCSLDSPVVQR